MNKQTLLTDFVPKIETITGFGGNEVQSHGCGTADATASTLIRETAI